MFPPSMKNTLSSVTDERRSRVPNAYSTDFTIADKSNDIFTLGVQKILAAVEHIHNLAVQNLALSKKLKENDINLKEND